VYTPIVRNRRSEVSAFKALSVKTKANTLPLFDLASPTKKSDVAATRAYVNRNIKSTVKVLGGFEAILLDSSELDPDLRLGRAHPLSIAAAAIAEVDCKPIPVTGLHRDEAHLKAALDIREKTDGGILGMRLDATDVGTASASEQLLQKFLGENSIAAGDVILLLDLQSVYGMDPDAVSHQVLRFLAKAQGTPWHAVIIAGYGVPDQLTAAISVRDQGYIPRVEQEVFYRVANAGATANVWFGDHTTLSPTHVELDWRLVSKVMAPKAVYALDDSWFVVRGGPFSTHKDGYAQYHDIAREIVALEEFSGPKYSAGDAYIHECATNAYATTGSPSSWITACVNHHITLTALAHTE
jgi:hypothetical protein